jgi:hypothetical protein
MAYDKTVTFEVGQVLAHRVGGDPEIGRDGLCAALALAPEQLEDLHAGRAAGDHQEPIRLRNGMLATA